jgi:enoyl-CoA hydratase
VTVPFEAVQYAVDDGVAAVVLNRPKVLNAINRLMHDELVGALEAAAADGNVRVVVLSGAGRSFSAGHDLKQDISLPLRTPEEWRSALGETLSLALMIWDHPKPVIASVHGHCLGKACQIALACDFVIAAEDASFGEPEVRTVSSSAFPILPWLVGQRRAKELLMLGRTVSGREAAEMGMTTRACSPESLAEETRQLAVELCDIPPAAVRLNKRAINHAVEAMGLRSVSAYNLEMLSSVVAREFEVAASTDFDRVRREQGLKAALEIRDGRPEQASA